MTKTAMLLFGYEHVWPRGNPTEPFWEHPTRSTFFELPTVEEFIARIERAAREDEARKIRGKFQDAFRSIRVNLEGY